MKGKILSLNKLLPGQKGKVKELNKKGAMRRRMQDIGLNENTEVECVGRSPGGDPAAYLIKSALIALRDEDSEAVLVEVWGEADSWV